MKTVLSELGGFDFHVDGVRALAHREIEHGELVLDGAVKLAMVLVAAAGGDDDAIRKLLQEACDGFGALGGVVQEIEAKFKEDLARFRLAPGVVEEGWNVWQAQRDTDARERSGLRHCVVGNSRITRAGRWAGSQFALGGGVAAAARRIFHSSRRSAVE